MNARAYPTWFAVGALLLYGIFTLLPSALGIVYSFTDWNSYTNELNWVGLDNFATILSAGSSYLHVITNTLLFTVATIILKTAIALGLAILFTDWHPASLALLPHARSTCRPSFPSSWSASSSVPS